MDLNKLKTEFPREAVSWRAKTLNKDGSKALALAYIDARDVMNRLDEVCGFDNWQDSYVESARGRVICSISIRIGNEWISKSDGAGDTAVEGEKGGISDAFKRAAVKWGIGRYLYDLDAVWVKCESYKSNNGKLVWSKWSQSPWECVRSAPQKNQEPAKQPRAPKDDELVKRNLDIISKHTEIDKLKAFYLQMPDNLQENKQIKNAVNKKKKEIESLDKALDGDNIPE